MKPIKLVMVLVLLFALASMSMAQTDNNTNTSPGTSDNNQANPSMVTPSQPTAPQSEPTSSQPTSYKATVQPGPAMRVGGQPSADVFVNGRLAVRIPASAGGMTPGARARIVANRLNAAFASGASWQDMRVTMTNGMYTVSIGGRLIVTADARSARVLHTSSGHLAYRWANNTVVALGGQPQMIASNLQPVRTRVAGSMEQAGAAPWSAENTKSVPLMFATNGNQMGNVMVAGPQSALSNVNSVVVYQNTNGQATIWTFVPITGTTISGTLSRVRGVGLVSVPSALIPSGFQTGGSVRDMVDSMSKQWDSTINSSLSQVGLPVDATTKVVPLYSMDMSQVIGGVQIVGLANPVHRAQAVVVSSNDNMYQFGATASPSNSMTGKPAMLHNVLVSSIIMVSPQGVTPPSMTQPSTTAPSTAVPSTTAPSTTAPSTEQPVSPPATTPDQSPQPTAPATPATPATP